MGTRDGPGVVGAVSARVTRGLRGREELSSSSEVEGQREAPVRRPGVRRRALALATCQAAGEAGGRRRQRSEAVCRRPARWQGGVRSRFRGTERLPRGARGLAILMDAASTFGA